MALTAQEQKYLDWALAMLPSWFKDDERSLEFLAGMAKLMGGVKTQADDWIGNTLITTAVGPVGNDPDWLNQHAIDRGTSRQPSESDVALRQRLRNVPDALTRPTLLSAAQAIVDAEAIVGTVYMVELKRDRAWFRTAASDTGTGGVFSAGPAGLWRFTPTVKFATPPYRTSPIDIDHKIVLSGALSAGNDGTYDTSGLVGDAVEYTVGGGQVAETDATVTWTVQKFDTAGNLLDGFQDSYLSRGHRMGGTRDRGPAAPLLGWDVPAIIMILPFGCTASTENSVLEMLRQKAAAGMAKMVECRANP